MCFRCPHMSSRTFSASFVPAHARPMVSTVVAATAIALTLAIVFLLAPGLIEPHALNAFIEEGGPLEVATVAGWMVAAIYLLLPGRRPRLPGLSFAFFCFTMGMRENGLPAGLVPHGRRLIQLGFYLHGPESLIYRVVAGLVVLAVLAAAVHVVIFVGREFIQRRGWLPVDTALFVLGMGVLVVSQIAEGVQDHPALAAALFPRGWNGMLSLESLEEGWEAVGAAYVMLAVHWSRKLGAAERQRLPG